MMLSFINAEHRSGPRFVPATIPARKSGASNVADFARSPLLNATGQGAYAFFRADHAESTASQPPSYETAVLKSVLTLRRHYSQSSEQTGHAVEGARSNTPAILLRLMSRLKTIAGDLGDLGLSPAPLVLEQHEYAATLRHGHVDKPSSPTALEPATGGEILTAENLSRHNSPEQSVRLLEHAAATDDAELFFADAEFLHTSQAQSERTSRAQSQAGSHDLQFELVSAGSSIAADDEAFVAARTLLRRRMPRFSVWNLLTSQDRASRSKQSAVPAPVFEASYSAANHDASTETPLALEFGSLEHAEPVVTSVYFEAQAPRARSAASSLLSEDDVPEQMRAAEALSIHFPRQSAAHGTE